MEKINANAYKEELQIKVDKQEFALALKTWRLRQNLTQRQVARLWGVSRYTIMRAEGAKTITWEMSYRLFAKLSTALRNENEDNL